MHPYRKPPDDKPNPLKPYPFWFIVGLWAIVSVYYLIIGLTGILLGEPTWSWFRLVELESGWFVAASASMVITRLLWRTR